MMEVSEKMKGSEPAARSEFLFCYDARMCNPNGDPDENRPRIDPATGRNLVTEFRLKRTVRDYLQKQKMGSIFLRQELADEKGSIKTIDDLAEDYTKSEKRQQRTLRERLLEDFIDLRLFGLLFAVRDFHFKQTGPVQFGIGQSLHKVDEMRLRMTRVVPTREEAKAGAFGEKSILRYSFIAFHGFLNDNVAKDVGLSEEDVSNMMRAIWFGTTDLSTTSKYGQQSRLLLRVNFKDPYAYIGDLDRMIALESQVSEERIEGISQVVLNLTNMFETLDNTKGDLQRIEWACDHELRCRKRDAFGSFDDLIRAFADETKMETINLLQEWRERQSLGLR
jgi:CRISPR-associated protein Csh2